MHPATGIGRATPRFPPASVYVHEGNRDTGRGRVLPERYEAEAAEVRLGKLRHTPSRLGVAPTARHRAGYKLPAHMQSKAVPPASLTRTACI